MRCEFFFIYTTTTEIDTVCHTLSLHGALPISGEAAVAPVSPAAEPAPSKERPRPVAKAPEEDDEAARARAKLRKGPAVPPKAPVRSRGEPQIGRAHV